MNSKPGGYTLNPTKRGESGNDNFNPNSSYSIKKSFNKKGYVNKELDVIIYRDTPEGRAKFNNDTLSNYSKKLDKKFEHGRNVQTFKYGTTKKGEYFPFNTFEWNCSARNPNQLLSQAWPEGIGATAYKLTDFSLSYHTSNPEYGNVELEIFSSPSPYPQFPDRSTSSVFVINGAEANKVIPINYKDPTINDSLYKKCGISEEFTPQFFDPSYDGWSFYYKIGHENFEWEDNEHWTLIGRILFKMEFEYISDVQSEEVVSIISIVLHSDGFSDAVRAMNQTNGYLSSLTNSSTSTQSKDGINVIPQKNIKSHPGLRINRGKGKLPLYCNVNNFMAKSGGYASTSSNDLSDASGIYDPISFGRSDLGLSNKEFKNGLLSCITGELGAHSGLFGTSLDAWTSPRRSIIAKGFKRSGANDLLDDAYIRIYQGGNAKSLYDSGVYAVSPQEQEVNIGYNWVFNVPAQTYTKSAMPSVAFNVTPGLGLSPAASEEEREKSHIYLYNAEGDLTAMNASALLLNSRTLPTLLGPNDSNNIFTLIAGFTAKVGKDFAIAAAKSLLQAGSNSSIKVYETSIDWKPQPCYTKIEKLDSTTSGRYAEFFGTFPSLCKYGPTGFVNPDKIIEGDTVSTSVNSVILLNNNVGVCNTDSIPDRIPFYSNNIINPILCCSIYSPTDQKENYLKSIFAVSTIAATQIQRTQDDYLLHVKSHNTPSMYSQIEFLRKVGDTTEITACRQLLMKQVAFNFNFSVESIPFPEYVVYLDENEELALRKAVEGDKLYFSLIIGVNSTCNFQDVPEGSIVFNSPWFTDNNDQPITKLAYTPVPNDPDSFYASALSSQVPYQAGDIPLGLTLGEWCQTFSIENRKLDAPVDPVSA